MADLLPSIASLIHFDGMLGEPIKGYSGHENKFTPGRIRTTDIQKGGSSDNAGDLSRVRISVSKRIILTDIIMVILIPRMRILGLFL